MQPSVQLPKPQSLPPVDNPSAVKSELPVETWWERKIRSHPLFARRTSPSRPIESTLFEVPLTSRFELSTSWLVATMLVYLLGTAIVVWVAFSS